VSRIEDAARAYVARVDDAGECNARPEYRALRNVVHESMRDDFLDKHSLDDTALNDPAHNPVATALAALGEAAQLFEFVCDDPLKDAAATAYVREKAIAYACAYARARKGER